MDSVNLRFSFCPDNRVEENQGKVRLRSKELFNLSDKQEIILNQSSIIMNRCYLGADDEERVIT